MKFSRRDFGTLSSFGIKELDFFYKGMEFDFGTLSSFGIKEQYPKTLI